MALRLLVRGLHSAVPKDTVRQAIRACIQLEVDVDVEKMRLGQDVQLDTKVIVAASRAASIPVPDNVLGKLGTVGDLLDYLCAPRTPPLVKGIPKFELFAGEELPPNVTLVNYRKKRWSNSTYTTFLKTSMRDAGLLPQRRPKESVAASADNE